MSLERGIEKSGYLEVKQPSTTKGRKLKSWKKRWVVVHQMSDLANGKFNAKIDIYLDEAAAKKKFVNDRMTFVLENISAVQLSKSKTHPNAFEVVESEPVLVFCAATDQETATWMSIYRRIFQHDKLGDYDIFGVHILPSSHTKRLNLEESVLLSVDTSTITVLTPDYKKVIEWKLSTIKRFYTEEDPNDHTKNMIILECGPNSASGEGKFCFTTPEWDLILRTIRKNINLAIAERQHLKLMDQHRDRSGSTSTTTSEFCTLLANSDTPTGPRSIRSDSEHSLGSSVFTSGSNPDCSQTPPLSPVSSSSKLDAPPITSTPNSTRSIRSASFNRTSVVVTEPPVEAGYSEIQCNTNNNNGDMQPRSGSISSTNSASSHNSTPRNSCMDDTNRTESLDHKPDVAPFRTVSNSFDSGFSNGSYEETTKRKGSDVDKIIMEETSDGKPDPCNIYQELDYSKVLKSRLSADETRERRHSTGDITKDPDYAELESRKTEDGIFGTANSELTVPLEVPPALPDRPASLRWSNSMKSKSKWKKRLSALLVPGHSPGNSPDRCESPVSHQKPQLISSDIVLDNIEGFVDCDGSSPEERSQRSSASDSEHLYQSIPEVLNQTSVKSANITNHEASERHSMASDILLSTDPFFEIENPTSSNPISDITSSNNNDTSKKPQSKSDPLIDFFFKDDGFEILQTTNSGNHNRSSASILTPVPFEITPEPEKLLINFNSSESLSVKSEQLNHFIEGHYMDMTNREPTGIQRIESVEYIPPSEMRAAISGGNLIDF